MLKYLLNNIVENNTIGMTQFKSIKKPNNKFPIRAPPLPKVKDNAAAITLLFVCVWKGVRKPTESVLKIAVCRAHDSSGNTLVSVINQSIFSEICTGTEEKWREKEKKSYNCN